MNCRLALVSMPLLRKKLLTTRMHRHGVVLDHPLKGCCKMVSVQYTRVIDTFAHLRALYAQGWFILPQSPIAAVISTKWSSPWKFSLEGKGLHCLGMFSECTVCYVASARVNVRDLQWRLLVCALVVCLVCILGLGLRQ